MNWTQGGQRRSTADVLHRGRYPHFLGGELLASTRRVTGTRKKELEGETEKGAERVRAKEKLAEFGAPANHFVTGSKLRHAPGERRAKGTGRCEKRSRVREESRCEESFRGHRRGDTDGWIEGGEDRDESTIPLLQTA